MTTESESPQEFEALLEYLKQSRGFDFLSYKRASLTRRVDKRMHMVGIETYEDYVDYLEVHPDEFSYLFNMVLINVTTFLRDPASWEYLQTDIIPKILESKEGDAPIRAWVAGCASGEEAYSLAMVLAEALGAKQFVQRVKIYATDVDEEALNHARQGSYTPRMVSGIPQHLLSKYFEQSGQRYLFRKDFRRSIIFGRHDLIQDAPISRIDLITCRNTLMYFNSEAQAKVLGRFNFALNKTGYLFLGKAEMLFAHSNIMMPVDIKRRVFMKAGKGVRDRDHNRDNGHDRERDRIALITHQGGGELGVPVMNNNVLMHVRIREAAFNADPLAQIIVDSSGMTAFVNDQARNLFGITLRDLGRPLHDLEISYRPVELRSCIEQVRRDHMTITLKDVEWGRINGEKLYLDVQVVPLLDIGDNLIGVKIIFADVSRYRQLREELRLSKQELETVYEEVQSTNEELVTTNEELQSTIEELETTNEELQSTNEELETMNEELQSTNEELETTNEELRQQEEEFNEVNVFLQSILTSVPAGVIVINRSLHIQAWNVRCEDLWGLRAEEVIGCHLLSLDSGFPGEKLKAVIRACLAGEEKVVQVVLAATNRRGKAIQCEITCTPLIIPGEAVQGVMLMMEECGDRELTPI